MYKYANLIIDGVDIDDQGHCRGPEMSCLNCHATTDTRCTYTRNWESALACDECMEIVAEPILAIPPGQLDIRLEAANAER